MTIISLQDVLKSNATTVECLNEANRGGTYIRFKCHRVQIPHSLQKAWGCVWSKIHDVMEYSQISYDNFSDEIWDFYGEKEPSETHKLIEMIFKESMSDFFSHILECETRQVFTYDSSAHRVITHPRMTLCDGVVFDDYDNTTTAESCGEARKVLVHALLTVEKHYPILRANHFLLEKCKYSDDNLVAEFAKKFKLSEFYKDRIGNITDFYQLDLEKFNLTADFLANEAMNLLPPSKQNIENWNALLERFAIP